MQERSADDEYRMAEFMRCQEGYWGSFTPLERDCLFKINMQEALGEAIDPVAKRIIQERADRHEEKWRNRNAARRGPRHWYVL